MEWERTAGQSGLPFVWIGHQKRIPTNWLIHLAEPCRPPPAVVDDPLEAIGPGDDHGVVVRSRARGDAQLPAGVWLVLQDLALDAESADGRLVASTSARLVAEHLQIDPGHGRRRVAGAARPRGRRARARHPERWALRARLYTLHCPGSRGVPHRVETPHTGEPLGDSAAHGKPATPLERRHARRPDSAPARLDPARPRAAVARRGHRRPSTSGRGDRERRGFACPEGWQVSVAIFRSGGGSC